MSTSHQMPEPKDKSKKALDLLGKLVLWIILLIAIGIGAVAVTYAIDGPSGYLNLSALLPPDLLALAANRYSAAGVVAAFLALYAALGPIVDPDQDPDQHKYVTQEQYKEDRAQDEAIKKAGEETIKKVEAENERLRKAADAKVQKQTMAARLAEMSKDFPDPGPDNPPRDDVKEAQTLLQALGYDLGTGGCDGIYGPKTFRALQAAIRDGLVG
jgi:hypothetical protein